MRRQLPKIGKWLSDTAISTLALSLVFTPIQVRYAQAQLVNTATAYGYIPNGDIIRSLPSTAIVMLAAQLPILTVNKSGLLSDNDGTPGVSPGDTVDYVIDVSNAGNVDITNVSAADVMAQDTTTLAYDAPLQVVSGDEVDPGTLNPGETWRYNGRLSLTRDIINNPSDIRNTVEISGTSDGVGVTGSDSADVPIPVSPSVTIVKNATVQTTQGAGDTLTWDITVTNNGDVALYGLSVADPQADALTCPTSGTAIIDVLGAGLAETCTATTLILSEDIVDGAVSNVATVSVDAPRVGDIVVSDDANVPVDTDRIPSVAGTVFTDLNSNGVFDAGDRREPGYIVQLRIGDILVADTIADPRGDYLFDEIGPGVYDIVFIDPQTNIAVGWIDTVTVDVDDVIIDQDLPIDPSGVVYNSFTGDPIPGVNVTITTASGSPLPAACLLPNQQNQRTGADGGYRFDIVAGANASFCPAGDTTYRLSVTPPSELQPLPSVIIAPQSGPLDASVCALDVNPGGSCMLSASADPSISNPSPYFLSFIFGRGDPDIVRNHIPVDPVPVVSEGDINLLKSASLRNVRIGDTFSYTITATNETDEAVGPIDIEDTLPSGFPWTPGTGRINGAPTQPAFDGRELTFKNITVPASGEVKVTFDVRVSSSVQPGEHVNVAIGTDTTFGNIVTNEALASVLVNAEPVFDCGDIIGKVFDDRNGNGFQDEGEEGLPGVRIASVNGVLITTDAYGRYSVPCAAIPDSTMGSNFILKLDERTLPTGFSTTTENPRVVRLTRGKLSKLNFGATQSRLVEFTVTDEAFDGPSVQLTPTFLDGIGQLAESIGNQPTLIRVTYVTNGDTSRLPVARLNNIEKHVRKHFLIKGIREDVEFESLVVYK
ncbi:MAG: SdrD B-like domain-containing protein [Pseudomonadota bacterium]